jgi:hypothetical protein
VMQYNSMHNNLIHIQICRSTSSGSRVEHLYTYDGC